MSVSRLLHRRVPVALAAAAGFLELLALAGCALPAAAQKRYDAGASDTAIRIGNIAAYSGASAAYGQDARAEAAYFKMINDRGGVNGRRIEFVSVDAAGSTDRTVDAARQLVEQEPVLLLFGVFGTAQNLAIRGYLNEHKVPQLFAQTASSQLDDPARFPWTMGFFATYRTEAQAYAKYLLRAKPQGRIAVLAADDDAGRELVAGLRDGLGGAAAAMIVGEIAFSPRDPRVAEHVAELKRSGADVFANLTIGRIATEAIAAAYDLDWHPLQLIPNASLSIRAFLEPAGLKKAAGVIANARSKGYLRPGATGDPEVRDFLAWMRRYNPDGSLRDAENVAGYERAEALVAVLARCGDDLRRENVMKQAASLDLTLPMLAPGIRVTTGAADYQPIKQLYLVRFDGEDWRSIDAIAAR